MSVPLPSPQYKTGEWVRCEVKGNLFIGPIRRCGNLHDMVLYQVAAELPQGSIPTLVKEREILGLV